MKKLLGILLVVLFASCEKEDTATGTLILGAYNDSKTNYSLSVFVDDVMQGSIQIKPYTHGNPVGWCDDLVGATQHDNIAVFPQIKPGTHTLKLKDTNNKVVLTGSFNLNSGKCTAYEVTM